MIVMTMMSWCDVINDTDDTCDDANGNHDVDGAAASAAGAADDGGEGK